MFSGSSGRAHEGKPFSQDAVDATLWYAAAPRLRNRLKRAQQLTADLQQKDQEAARVSMKVCFCFGRRIQMCLRQFTYLYVILGRVSLSIVDPRLLGGFTWLLLGSSLLVKCNTPGLHGTSTDVG